LRPGCVVAVDGEGGLWCSVIVEHSKRRLYSSVVTRHLPCLVESLEPEVRNVGRVSPADEAFKVLLLSGDRGNSVGLSGSSSGPTSLTDPDGLSVGGLSHGVHVVDHSLDGVLNVNSLPESESVKHKNIGDSDNFFGLFEVDISVSDGDLCGTELFQKSLNLSDLVSEVTSKSRCQLSTVTGIIISVEVL